MSSKINGNRLKGNKGKKGRRGRKEEHADFDPATDSFGKIISGLGSCQMSVQLLDEPNAKPVNAHIRGIHRGKLFFKKDDYVVIRHNGNLREIWGRVSEGDIRRVREDFAKIEGKGDKSSVIFRDANDLEDDESDEEDVVPPQPNRSVLDEPTDDADINIDDI
ncbi:hypothetical protein YASMINEVIRUS_273 [Yasminevirus sp. GU-2018]|uniref:Uncharacterized protein n=1 Tax=Yasminevirus sp. GU-2018 TaxID=2420051 RepID=A0A5K0U7Q3_9VIRU|nr:hypothetical protein YASMINEVIRUS_273 [Yasminevirus sp. GU-2018]